MGKKDGWIKIYRSIMDNEFYTIKPFDKCRAWIDLLLLAEHKTHKKMWRGNMETFKRGDVNLSIQALSNRWGWSRKKTRHFLEQLEEMEMIHLMAHQKRTTITIVKYDDFQSRGTTEGTSKGTSKGTSDGTKKGTTEGTYLKKKDKEEKEIKEAATPISDEMAAAKKSKERIEVIPGYTQEELDESFIDGFIPMTEEEWNALPEV